jgi:hypothetical protein
MQDLPPLALFGVPVTALIILIIEALKRGWPELFAQAKAAIITAFVLSMIFVALISALGPDYSAKTIALNFLAGLAACLSSCGLYDVGRAIGYKSLNQDGTKQKT